MAKICQPWCKTLQILSSANLTAPSREIYYCHTQFTDEGIWETPHMIAQYHPQLNDGTQAQIPVWWIWQLKLLTSWILAWCKGLKLTWYLIPWVVQPAIEPDMAIAADSTTWDVIQHFWELASPHSVYPGLKASSLSLLRPPFISVYTGKHQANTSQSSPSHLKNKLLPRNCVCRVKTSTPSSVAKQERAQNGEWRMNQCV